MKQRIFLIHAWGGSPNNDWFPWAIKVFKNRGYEVIAPSMPDTDHPTINSWVDTLSRLVGTPRKTDILVGHSVGTQTILRYLQTINTQFNKVILVAPWLTLTNLENRGAWQIADPWLTTPIDFNKVKSKAQTFITIFSDNDPWVPFEENKYLFIEHLNPRVITLHNLGHITADEGVTKLPPLFEVI